MWAVLDRMEQPSVRQAALFLVVLALLLPFPWARSPFGAWLAWLPDGVVSPLAAALLATGVVLNLRLIGRLPFPVQVAIVWAELLGLFLLFFYSFNLDYGFILSRLAGADRPRRRRRVPAGRDPHAVHLLRLDSRLDGHRPGRGAWPAVGQRPGVRRRHLLHLVLPRRAAAAAGPADLPGAPAARAVLDAVPAGAIALSLCYGAYMAEIFRAGIQSIPRGQWDGAASLGLSPARTMRLVILPQAVRLIIPPTGNQFIAMLKTAAWSR